MNSLAKPLPRRFYVRRADLVAPELIGKLLVHHEHVARIVEVEAYLGPADPASHAYRGETARNRVLFGPPGHAYVYLIYGMYECLNVACEPEGSPGCVLIRAAEPFIGPGRLTRGMGITREHYGADLTRGSLTICEGRPCATVATSPRIGIREAVDWPLRFFDAESRYVSKLRKS